MLHFPLPRIFKRGSGGAYAAFAPHFSPDQSFLQSAGSETAGSAQACAATICTIEIFASGDSRCDGKYRFTDIQAGSSALFVNSPGFQRFDLSNVYLGIGRDNEIDATLNVGAASQSVEVQSSAPMVNTENAEVSEIAGKQGVEAEGKSAGDFFEYKISQKITIGKNQSVQHPLAKNWMELEAARLMVMCGAWQFDNGLNSGAAANAAKYLAAEAGLSACQNAVMTHGGFGYAKEFHVERYLREMMIPWIAPITPNLILCYIAERVLGLPKSY